MLKDPTDETGNRSGKRIHHMHTERGVTIPNGWRVSINLKVRPTEQKISQTKWQQVHSQKKKSINKNIGLENKFHRQTKTNNPDRFLLIFALQTHNMKEIQMSHYWWEWRGKSTVILEQTSGRTIGIAYENFKACPLWPSAPFLGIFLGR